MTNPAQDAFIRNILGIDPAQYSQASPSQTSDGDVSPAPPSVAAKGNPSGGAAAADAAPRHRPTSEELQAEIEDLKKQVEEEKKAAARSGAPNKEQQNFNQQQTKTDVILIAATALLKNYVVLSLEIEKWANAKRAEIRKMKAHQTPTAGGLFLAVAQSLEKLTEMAFPELMILEYAGKSLDVTEKVRAILEDNNKDEDADTDAAVKIAQANCEHELDDLVTSTKSDLNKTQDRIEVVLKGKLPKVDPKLLAQFSSIGHDQYEEIRNFLAKNFEISRGSDADPGIVDKIVRGLNLTFNRWVMKDYQTRHLSKAATDLAGSDSVQRRFLIELYAEYMDEGPLAMPKIESRIEQAEVESVKQFGLKWGYEKAFKAMVDKIRDGYSELYQA